MAKKEKCTRQGHNPPEFVTLLPGKYIWKCEFCGKEQTYKVESLEYCSHNKTKINQ